MLEAIALSTRLQLLRYPFLQETRVARQKVARDIRSLIERVTEDNGTYVIDEAATRVISALEQSEIIVVNTNDDRDLLIYSVARLLVEKIGDRRLKEYQAEAESKAVNKHLTKEKDAYVLDLCKTSFGWDVESIGDIRAKAKLPLYLRSFDFKMHFKDFLEVAPSFHAGEWKLVNRYVEDGWVPIRKSELYRLISGKFKKLILASEIAAPNLPSHMTAVIQRIESEVRVKIKRTTPIQITSTTVDAFPPCISQMHADSMQGKNLSHDARFALASFLLKIGMETDDVLGVFKAAPDFVRGLAEYQVRHIASKSGGEGYTPPSCKKIQGSSLCPVYLGAVSDPLCEFIVHPLSFYETRAWEVSKGIEDHSWYAKKKRRMQSF